MKISVPVFVGVARQLSIPFKPNLQVNIILLAAAVVSVQIQAGGQNNKAARWRGVGFKSVASSLRGSQHTPGLRWSHQGSVDYGV